MNAESGSGQDSEISPFVVRLSLSESETTNQGQVEGYNEEYSRNDSCSFPQNRYSNFPNKHFSCMNIPTTNPGRNKRKNFNPRYTTSTSSPKSGGGNDGNSCSMTSTDNQIELKDNLHTYRWSEIENMSRSSKSPASPGSERVSLRESEICSVAPHTTANNIPSWMKMFNHYDQLVKAATMAQYQIHPSGSGYHQVGIGENAAEWTPKFKNNDMTVSAIRDLLKMYQGSRGRGTIQLDSGVKLFTPPTTPHTCNSSTGTISNGGSGDHGTSITTTCRSPLENVDIKQEILRLSLPPSTASTEFLDINHPKNLISNKRESPIMSEKLIHHKWNITDTAQIEEYSDQTKWNKESSSGHECDKRNNKTVKKEKESFTSYHDDSLDCCDRQQATSSSSSQHYHLRQWCEDFQKISESLDKSIKGECDDTDTTTNNPYDEDDYPSPSLNDDFCDSGNDDEDDNYGMNIYYDDEQSTTADEQIRPSCSLKSNRNAMESDDVDETHRNIVTEREGSGSNSSSKISVQNFGGFFEQTQLNMIPSKLRAEIDEKGLHSDFVQNLNKFTSCLECQNEMCRLENLREHYHCYDFPCFGKILSKKEEVIRHVKWHRKRMESLNHGFMRFSSSDDCSTTFGNNCQHNRKQTHYHCFQPNCDRVYISTSDVQMHSNFHRKDSAIHKEGFQRFRANEKCSAVYCMFSDQKTTHFHCRRENCQYTFKNKADMEKHKTYHIKDLKLARDGFKKFLKSEPCPYKQCRFSKVCNHIHCARENCFYVLHSSGQLLSHKRKHERIDNEQTYCRYKMLAVKAALLGNAAAAAAISPEKPPYNLTNSLLQLRDLEIRHSSEPSSLTSLKEKQCSTESPSSLSTLSMDFLQQMKKTHEAISNQQQKRHHFISDLMVDPKISMFPVIQKSDILQYQTLNPTNLTPSVIQQFFSTECLSPKLEKNYEPINLKNDHPSLSDRNPNKVQRSSCSWKGGLEPHLHCIVQDCEAVIPNNILDISAHIRIHGQSRCASPPATVPLQTSNTGSSNSNPMQITTIDGFFNRKRGRPPKNRFVEVYKNAQQSPQAIFTSFKLEKQITGKDRSSTPSDTASSLSYNQPPNLCMDKQQIGQLDEKSHIMNLSPTTTLVQNPIASQFTTHKANEQCGEAGGARCSLAMQDHYHCVCSVDCTFITVERDLLSVHLERQHTSPMFADTISKKFKRFDRTIGLDCGINECKLRKTRPHLHCRKCYRQISPFDLETHNCDNSEQRSMSSSPTKKLSTLGSPEYHRIEQPQISCDNFKIHSGKHIIRDYVQTLPSVTFSTLTELRKKVSEMEPVANSLPKRNHEDEKVLVVRAAGTYFPENTSELSGANSSQGQQGQQKMPTHSLTTTDCLQVSFSTSGYCSTPYCKMKRKPHEHCEFCVQSFVDSAKSQAHRLQHVASPTKTDTGEDNKQTTSPQPIQTTYASSPNNDDKPQDLSLTPSSISTMQQDDGIKASIETLTPASPAQQLPGRFSNLFPPDLMCSISMQNFHLAHLATLYQQNPYYYQHLYPFLNNTAAFTRNRQAQTYRIPNNEDKKYLPSEYPKPTVAAPSTASSGDFPFLNPLLMVQATETVSINQTPPTPLTTAGISRPSCSNIGSAKFLKRKLTNGGDDLNAFIDALSPSAKKQMQFAAGLAAATAAAAATGETTPGEDGPARSNHDQQHGQHFKIKDEAIPTGYLKFRFNEDCYFPKCGYRNHQSHFHCDRNDCHYSFCDKTRFVQHTARHERLDKLMGNDFRQYRANMSCGYENCPYFKNLGSSNKSSHFHCLKCDFICSDTNKVVAHRRQHSKMEYIRMAGFRKVTNSEKCNSTFEATVPANGNDMPRTVECSYSQKQTHYHCLVCDVSVLSRAQLASHKHKT